MLVPCLVSIAVAANDDPASLEKIIISATRSEQSTVSSPGSITVISRAQISNSGATTLAEVLRGQGGVQIRDLYGDGSRLSISMRGFGANAASNTLVLVDGRRLNNPDLAPPNLNTIALNEIERIEIIQGSAGSLYGDQAVGGLINIITRSPRQLEASVEAAAGSYDRHDLSMRIANRLDNGLGFRLSLDDSKADNYRKHNERDYRNISGRLDYDYTSGLVFLEYQDMDEDINLPGGLFRAQYDADRRQPQYPNDSADTSSRSGRLGIRQMLTDNWQLEAETTARDTEVNGSLSNTAFSQDRQVSELMPRLIGSYLLDNGELLITTGVDVIHSEYEIASIFGTTENDQDISSFYVQAVIPVTPVLQLTVGARSASVNNDLTDSFAYPAGIDLDDDETAAELGISYFPAQSWRLFLRADENFRFAKVDEQTQTLGGITGLDTQTGTSYEAGAEWNRAGNSFKAVLYHLDLDNEIAYDTSVYANVNLDPTTRDGIIIEGTYSPFTKLSVSGQYGYIDARFDEGIHSGNRIPFVAEHTAHLSATYQLNNEWTLFGEMQYIDDRIAAGDVTNTLETLDDYTVYNLNINYTRPAWQASLRINNLTDKKYSDYAASSYNPATFTNETGFYAAPERNFMLTARYNFY
jgi:iron complex outermembrane receptor protein